MSAMMMTGAGVMVVAVAVAAVAVRFFLKHKNELWAQAPVEKAVVKSGAAVVSRSHEEELRMNPMYSHLPQNVHYVGDVVNNPAYSHLECNIYH